ncbi:bifunctional 2-C-methyl-D-erythritol 4-phosphate cytidylyltransferase/2-C-methyl-D-erythritol 2,4-cyclodiphosphate synthase [Sphingomonas sp. HDW15A]|uniref:bifunctional 2-C-methyl-D-erythritol 4-phosphate cytidylyltransferase/2-C-methyl-D-erythritol 2,4-cyclodiphosphate synthase n=1 Tax=Sphingomonas sp. HDW15A TaxID=2714942 RepID=UPI00140D6AB4|nr:bifunctional 2-C-methyl-D-erythritol 4-phosphate cytidylyltransferase/2-C-methyl-D-erythritol 2,4-cyclodiphosphate synthase [Sphingomonas sp. HDW15A]QIK96071.1 bifunctional 2-C-methyl-D-erythritol 4-phosphate cytidylyltransferase/2-C-methyl-D-erythritol 2,4-cyclodiphosphate synthase [Sphingomonas sp. HDW15A]
MSVTAIIVAAGSGSRMGGELPKQFREIAGKAVLAHAVDALRSHSGVDSIRIVIAPGQEITAKAAMGDRDVGPFVTGGATRGESVANGLRGVADDELVLIHDAARPFCPPQVIDRLLAALEQAPAAIPALPVADTLAAGTDRIERMADRKGLVRVQTPQAFRVRELRAALAKSGGVELTDESSAMVAAGMGVVIVEGDPMLEKLTTQADFDRAEALQGAALVSRTGMGFDVHAFSGEGPIMMGGIAIPHERGLAGHSDADVVLHAITDAILGAIAEGDIGQHFPPSDPQWKGASSDRFLAHAAQLARNGGGKIDHVDCTVICEVPKVGPYREAMRNRVAEILDLPVPKVSIKATTTERLGFAGRGEGIAAQAIATIRMPQ